MKLKIQRGHPKVTAVTFNLKWLGVQEKQLFWCQSSKDSQVLSLETIVLSGLEAFYSSAYSFLLIFSSFLFMLSIQSYHRYKCNSGKLLKTEESANHGSLIMKFQTRGRDWCLGARSHIYTLQNLTSLVTFITLSSKYWIFWLSHRRKGRKGIFKTEFMPKDKSIFWELRRFRWCKGM